jgi:hypothetical protein
MIEEQQQQKKGYLKPIPPDESLERMNKNSLVYRKRKRQLECSACFNQATQMMCYDVDGATVIERYCDSCIAAGKSE